MFFRPFLEFYTFLEGSQVSFIESSKRRQNDDRNLDLLYKAYQKKGKSQKVEHQKRLKSVVSARGWGGLTSLLILVIFFYQKNDLRKLSDINQSFEPSPYY